jgi:hypothetical protein
MAFDAFEVAAQKNGIVGFGFEALQMSYIRFTKF